MRDYLNRRKKFTVINGKQSDPTYVTYGIPQGSVLHHHHVLFPLREIGPWTVLGPTLFNLYTSDLPDSVSSGEVYMYADDSSIYCESVSIDQAAAMLML